MNGCDVIKTPSGEAWLRGLIGTELLESELTPQLRHWLEVNKIVSRAWAEQQRTEQRRKLRPEETDLMEAETFNAFNQSTALATAIMRAKIMLGEMPPFHESADVRD